MVSRSKSFWGLICLSIFIAILSTGCVTQAFARAEANYKAQEEQEVQEQPVTREASNQTAPVSQPTATAVIVAAADLPSVSRAPDDLPGPVARSAAQHVQLDLETVEVAGRLADGTNYSFWTFNGKVPGPFVRIRIGDTVEVRLKNADTSTMVHSVDFHAVTGPGGGAVATQTQPGEETSFTFKALNPGLYVYHCATPMVAHHIANGMYGLILVEPEGGLPPVDREFYVMQGEIYTAEPLNQKGDTTFSLEKLLDESPEYLVFNGAVGALTGEHPLEARVGETVRIFFGVGGPNFTSSFHVIGEIFDRVYEHASLTSPPLIDVQTTLIPTGGATMVEFTVEVPGRYILVDHSLSRLERGLAGFLVVEGPEDPEIFDGEATGDGGGH
jgi:nitrite reductase (NO-forming)